MKKAVQNRLSPQARKAIRRLLREHQATNQAVSTYDAIQEVRRRLPELAISDAELSNCIAGTAISLDLMVAFDSRIYDALR